MYRIYDKWPQISNEYYNSDADTVNFENISNIVFAGMGGSGAIGDVFSSILSKTNIHVNVVKGYLLPKTVNSNSLVVVTSVSGNTEEALSILHSAKKNNSKIISFSNGGKIEKFCKKNNVQYRKIKMLHSPRASFTAFLYSMLNVLSPVLPIKKNEVKESLRNLQKLHRKINSKNLTDSNPSLSLGKWIKGIPLIYYPWGLQSVAIRFKNSLQENAKVHAMTEDIIETSHNGVVSWERKSNVIPILIEGQNDYIKTKERQQILKSYFDQRNIEYREIISIKGNILTKIINMIYLLDYSTIYNAVGNKIDPSPVKSIEFIKNKL